MSVLRGVGASPGVATGPVVRMPGPVPEPSTSPAPDDRHQEAAKIAPAIATVCADLRNRAAAAEGETGDVLQAIAAMAEDPSLRELSEQRVLADGLPAPRAVWETATEFAQRLFDVGGYVAARAADLEDIRNRVVASLLGLPMPNVPDVGHPFILVARDLAPADTATLDPRHVLALVTVEGGPTSHTAIVARALGIAAVVACPDALKLSDGMSITVDGTSGTVALGRPDDFRPARPPTPLARDLSTRGGATKDGHVVSLLANVSRLADVEAAVSAGAEGVGLLRTEFLFLDRRTEPSAKEQTDVYSRVFAAFPGSQVVVRTLDAGGDRPLRFLRAAAEPNPALGLRGLRISLVETHILTRQLGAIATAAEGARADVWVMAPMVAVASEAGQFAELARAAGLPKLGVMIEVPSAALTAAEVFAEVDFVSVGTNDLTQYTMAADRMSGALAALNDPWQPAVLRLADMCIAAGVAAAKPVGVCGEAAADPLLALVLVGLGASSLSMSPRAIPEVAARLAATTYGECQHLAALAREAPTATHARVAVQAHVAGSNP